MVTYVVTSVTALSTIAFAVSSARALAEFADHRRRGTPSNVLKFPGRP